ncbi:MAG: hypothetical protein ACR652_05305 [Methylocystis sp.]|uniref:hypothetical protein n=1 Tax=Methylocystis sp. TaxID=1911079 RepID=UPI003DA3890E
MRYEFQSMLYQTADEMCLAIASTWLSPSGRNDRKQMDEILAYKTNEELADDAVKGLGLDCSEASSRNPQPCTWMEERGITRDNIVAAFARVRKDLDEAQP